MHAKSSPHRANLRSLSGIAGERMPYLRRHQGDFVGNTGGRSDARLCGELCGKLCVKPRIDIAYQAIPCREASWERLVAKWYKFCLDFFDVVIPTRRNSRCLIDERRPREAV